jgi:uncharacterized membrane protein YdcZ (DUF606 family)
MRRRQLLFFRAAALITACSALLYCSWPLGFWLNPLAMHSGLASELGAFGQPYNWVFIAGDIVSGVLLVLAAVLLMRLYRLRGAARLAVWLLAVYGICGALDAALPMRCLPSLQVCGPIFHDPLLVLHGVFDFVGSIALFGTLLAAAQYVHRQNQQWRPWIYVMGFGGALFALLSLVLYVAHGPGYWAQRYYITLSCIWVMSLPFIVRPKYATLKQLT